MQAVAPRAADELLTAVASLPEPSLYEQLTEASLWAPCRTPSASRRVCATTAAAPWALFGRADPDLLGRLVPREAVAVVGSLSRHHDGRQVADLLNFGQLAAEGIAVVSGLAFGIDSCAHRVLWTRG